jgi:hypothetical protein
VQWLPAPCLPASWHLLLRMAGGGLRRRVLLKITNKLRLNRKKPLYPLLFSSGSLTAAGFPQPVAQLNHPENPHQASVTHRYSPCSPFGLRGTDKHASGGSPAEGDGTQARQLAPILSRLHCGRHSRHNTTATGHKTQKRCTVRQTGFQGLRLCSIKAQSSSSRADFNSAQISADFCGDPPCRSTARQGRQFYILSCLKWAPSPSQETIPPPVCVYAHQVVIHAQPEARALRPHGRRVVLRPFAGALWWLGLNQLRRVVRAPLA